LANASTSLARGKVRAHPIS